MLTGKNTLRAYTKSLLTLCLAIAGLAFTANSDEINTTGNAKYFEKPVPSLKASREYTDCVRLNWPRVDRAVRYQIYRKRMDCSNCEWGRIEEDEYNNSFNDSDAEAGKKYEYLVTAVLKTQPNPAHFNPDDWKTWGLKKKRIIALATPELLPLDYDQGDRIHIDWSDVPDAKWYTVYIFETHHQLDDTNTGERLLLSEDSTITLANYAKAYTNQYTWNLSLNRDRYYYVTLRAENEDAISYFTPLTLVLNAQKSTGTFAYRNFSDSDNHPEHVQRFIMDNLSVATEVSNEFNIPVPILLAVASLESNFGRSPLATAANNYFGIKADHTWDGATYTKAVSEMNGESSSHFYRRYERPETGFRDFAQLIRDTPQYSWLSKISCLNYEDWVMGLHKTGLNSDISYASKMLHVIRRFELYKYCGTTLDREWSPKNAPRRGSIHFNP